MNNMKSVLHTMLFIILSSSMLDASDAAKEKLHETIKNMSPNAKQLLINASNQASSVKQNGSPSRNQSTDEKK